MFFLPSRFPYLNRLKKSRQKRAPQMYTQGHFKYRSSLSPSPSVSPCNLHFSTGLELLEPLILYRCFFPASNYDIGKLFSLFCLPQDLEKVDV